MNNWIKTSYVAGLFVIQVTTVLAESSGYVLPLELASAAAAEAIKECESAGYYVSATVVDISGVVKILAKGDKSTIHTKDTSFRKAYTAVTMGPIFKFETTGQFVEKLGKASSATEAGKIPNATALANIPDIILLQGGVVIRAKGEIVAAIGVGGAPGGDKDEICAQAGVAKIRDRLPK